MITGLYIKNFRSIRDASLDLGRFTVLNGENNSGKSSVLYALQVLKNIVTSPNRNMDDLLNLNFLNLGGIEEVSFAKNLENDLSIGIGSEIFSSSKPKNSSSKPENHSLFFWEHSAKGNSLVIQGRVPFTFDGILNISFPYALNKKQRIEFGGKAVGGFTWNGISAHDFEGDFSKEDALDLVIETERCILNLTSLDVIPTHRGFTKTTFNPIPLQSHIYTEDEIATLLATDKILQSQVAHYFKKITGKHFSVSMSPGAGFFFLQVGESDKTFTTELVNQGMGINQIVFLLAKILYNKNRLICIDEPEIHLHPALIEKFVEVLVEISKKEGKQFLFSTHSEHWILSLLAEVCEENLSPDDLKVYYLKKKGAATIIENQEVQDNGQIEGGLKNFLESQMRLSQRFFPVEMPG